jgi:hypothetical protein
MNHPKPIKALSVQSEFANSTSTAELAVHKNMTALPFMVYLFITIPGNSISPIGGYVEFLHFSHFHHVSLVQWTKSLLPATKGSSSRPGVQPTLWNWDYMLALSHYCGDPDVIPDYRP